MSYITSEMSTRIYHSSFSFTCGFDDRFIACPPMDTNSPIKFLPSDQGISLAYCYRDGREDVPTVVFLSGYHSDMEGTKAVAVDAYCAAHNISCLRLDYSGHGQSGGDFRQGTIGRWTKDAAEVIQYATRGKLVIIGSSMGGWIGLLVAQRIPNRVIAYIGVSAAPDFTDWVWHDQMDEEARLLCRHQGYIHTPGGDVMTLQLFEEGAQHLLLHSPLSVPFPVILLHGGMDAEVPVTIADRLEKVLIAPSVKKTIIPDGTHRLSREEDIRVLLQIVASAIANP